MTSREEREEVDRDGTQNKKSRVVKTNFTLSLSSSDDDHSDMIDVFSFFLLLF